MGFDLGIALGAGAKSSLDTYSKVSEINRETEKAKREEEQFGWQKKEQDRLNQEQEAATNTYGKVGTQDYSQAIQTEGGAGSQQARMLSDQAAGMGPEGEAASAQSVANAMQQNAGKEALTSALPSQTYTKEKAAEDYANKMYAINPEKAKASELTGLQLKAAKRDDKTAEDFKAEQESYMNNIKKIHIVGASDGLKGLSNLATEEGLKTRFKEGKDGLGVVELLGPKGDVLKTFGDVDSATQALVQAAQGKFTSKLESMFGDAKTAANYYIEKQKIGVQERSANVQESELAAKIKANLFGAQAYQATAAGNASNAHTMVYKNMLELGKTSKEANAAMKPFIQEFSELSAEEQAGTKGQGLLLKAASAAATKTNDITGIINALKKPDKNSVNQGWKEMELKYISNPNYTPKDIASAKEDYYISNGFAALPAQAVQKADITKLLKQGKIEEAKEVLDGFNTRFPNTPITMPKVEEGAKTAINTKVPSKPSKEIPYTVPDVEIIPSRTGTKYKVQGLGSFNSMEEAQAAKKANKEQRIKPAPGTFNSAFTLG